MPVQTRSQRKSLGKTAQEMSSEGDNGGYTVWLKSSVGMLPFRNTLGPFLLVTCIPPLMIFLPHILRDLDGSALALWNKWRREGFFAATYNIWPACDDPIAVKIILALVISQLILVRIVPGRIYTSPPTAAGEQYSYCINGLAGFIITALLYYLGYHFGVYPGGIIVDKLAQIISTMNVVMLVFCFLLYLKGKYMPSSADYGCTGNFIFDYYWGTELNPRICGYDVKQMTNSRFGMVFWGLFALSAVLKQQETLGYVSHNMCVSAGLQMLYVLKFYYWEDGYYSSYDIHHDYAGFYICWGCCVSLFRSDVKLTRDNVYIPGMYNAHTYYIAYHPINFGWQLAIAMFVIGTLCCIIQYDADTQSRRFRELNGKIQIWGRPAQYILAKYKTGDGEERTNLLLCSGYYGDLKVRHLRYVLDITLSAMWVLPVCTVQLTPNIYLIYITLLLIDRMYRIDRRCHLKYGAYWEEYCKRVPYLLIPYVL